MTETLAHMNPGDNQSIDALLPLVYAELRSLASAQLNEHRDADGRSHTLQPTALVHEAFLKMVGNDKGWSGRDHFMAVASIAMRQVLVDHARKHAAAKRGGDGGAPAARASLSIDTVMAELETSREMQVIDLDDLLKELAASSERTARVAEMRLFGGMEQDQIARVLGVSRMTVHRDWLVARAWLAAKFQDQQGKGAARGGGESGRESGAHGQR